MNKGTTARLAPLTGLLFAALLLIVLLVTGNGEPKATDSTAKVVAYWHAHHSREMLGSLLGSLAAVSLIWFGAALFAHLRRAEGDPGRLSALALAGFTIAGVGGLIFGALGFTAADIADHVPNDVPASVLQTISALGFDMFLPFAGGILIALLATGLVALRHGALPGWLAWLGIVIGVVSFTPAGFFAVYALLAWVAITAVVLYGAQQAPAP